MTWAISLGALLRLLCDKGAIETDARGCIMAWTTTAMNMLFGPTGANQSTLTRIAISALGSQANVNEPVTAIEMRTLFAGDLRSADTFMSVSYG